MIMKGMLNHGQVVWRNSTDNKPFFESGDLDIKSFESIISYGIEKGIHGIFVMGFCGESSCVSNKQRYSIIKEAKKIISNRVPLLSGGFRNIYK